MSWIENMTINIFPMVLVIVVLISNRFKVGKARSARLFDHIIIFDFMLMFVDIIGGWHVREYLRGCGKQNVGYQCYEDASHYFPYYNVACVRVP